MSERAISATKHIPIGDVNRLLDDLADAPDKKVIIQRVISSFTAREQKWLMRIIFNDLKVSVCHPILASCEKKSSSCTKDKCVPPQLEVCPHGLYRPVPSHAIVSSVVNLLITASCCSLFLSLSPSLSSCQIHLKHEAILKELGPDGKAIDLFNSTASLWDVSKELYAYYTGKGDPSVWGGGEDASGAAGGVYKGTFKAGSVDLMTPFYPMLAARPHEPAIDNCISKMSGGTGPNGKPLDPPSLLVDYKIDGERMLIHRNGNDIKIYSRKSTDYTKYYGKPMQALFKNNIRANKVRPIQSEGEDEEKDEMLCIPPNLPTHTDILPCNEGGDGCRV